MASDRQTMTTATDRRLGRNITALTGGQVLTWSMTLVWTFVVPRALGPSGMGVIVSAWSVTGILGVVLGLGTRNYLTREMVVDPDASPGLIGTAIVLRVLLAPLFFVAVLVYAQFAHYGSEGNLVLYLASAATVLTLLAEPMQAGFQALERMEYLAYSDVINKSAQGLLGVGLVLLGFRAVGITACWMVVSGVVIFLDVLWLRPHVAVSFRTTGRRMVQMTKESLAYWAFGLFFMVYLWIDSVMLSLMTKSEVVGWYGVPTKLFQTLLFVPVIISTAWLPRLVAAFTDGPEHLRRKARAPLEMVLALSLPVAGATVVGARPVIHLLYGGAYAEAIPVMVILGLCIPPMYMNIMLSQVLVAAKRQVVWTWVMAGATLVNPLLNVVLIRATQHRYGNGAIGAAISLVVTEVLIVAVGFVIVGRGAFERRSVLRCVRVAAASAGMCAAGWLTRPLGSVASLAAAGGAFLLLAVVLRIATPQERAVAMAYVRRAGGRSGSEWRHSSRRVRPTGAEPDSPAEAYQLRDA
jgi:O-antigen/teichoic acid export membrane protein